MIKIIGDNELEWTSEEIGIIEISGLSDENESNVMAVFLVDETTDARVYASITNPNIVFTIYNNANDFIKYKLEDNDDNMVVTYQENELKCHYALISSCNEIDASMATHFEESLMRLNEFKTLKKSCSKYLSN